MNLYGYGDFGEWFNSDAYNPPDNPFIQRNGQAFMFVCPDDTMVEIEITW